MCRLFVNQDPATYLSETRAIRLHGHVTSLRLEASFWTILEEIAALEDMPLSRFVATLHDEILAKYGEMGNFASFLRVTCLHYIRNREPHGGQIVRQEVLENSEPVSLVLA